MRDFILKAFIISTMIFCDNYMCAQEKTHIITGEIENIDSIGIYSVTAIMGSDTIRGSFADKRFSMPVDSAGLYQLIVSSLGFNDFCTSVELPDNNIADLGKISLSKEKNVRLQEVVVKGKRCVVNRQGTTFEISNIYGTYLGDAGNILDMLQWTPGLMRNGSDGIQTTTGAIPVIYINGQKVGSTDELKAYSSSEVAKIEVIRDPGARYSSSTKAVINITLRKHLKDYVGVRVEDEVHFGRRISDDADFYLSTKTGKLSTFWGLHYELTRTKAHSEQLTSIAATNSYASLSDYMEQQWKRHHHGYFAVGGMTYNFSSNSSLSLQYNGNFLTTKRTLTGLHELSDNNVLKTYIENENIPKDHNNSNSVNLGYSLQKKSSNLDINTKYTHIDASMYKFVEQSEKGKNPVGKGNKTNISNKSGYDVLSFEGNYTFEAGKIGSIGVGVSSDYINNNTNYATNDIPQDSKRKDFVQGTYISLSRRMNKLRLNTELRYEYTHTSLTNIGNKNTQAFSSILPYVRITYSFSNSQSLEFGYRRIPTRPSISKLNNIVTYSDLIHSVTGNPELKTTINNTLWIDYGIKDFEASLYVMHKSHNIIDGTFMQENSRTILSRPVNTRYSNQYKMSLGYSHSGSKYNIAARLQEVYTKVKFYDTEGLSNRNMNNWHTSIFLDGSWRFYKTLEAYTSLSYESPWLEGNVKTGEMWGMYAGIKASLLKRKLLVSLEGEDLLHKGVTPYWSSQFANVNEWRRNHFDTRILTLKVQLYINTIHSDYKNKYIGREADLRSN